MSATLTQLRYMHHLVGGLRQAARMYSPTDDMAALSFPRAIQLQTINACQASCIMCPYSTYKNVFARGRMEEALFDRITEEIASRPEVTTFIPMLQNEPFLDKHIFEKVRRFKERTAGRVRVELVTNGAFLTDENIARIRESGLDVLDISLDALSRETYRRIRVGLDYDAVMAGVDRVLNAHLPNTSVFVRLLRLKDNRHEVKAFARHWRRRGVPVFIYSAHNRAGAVANYEGAVRTPDAQLTWVEHLERRAFRFFLKHCPIPFASTNILHNGDVLMCVHDWARKEIVGNVTHSSLAEIWNGERMRELRRLVSQRRYEDVPGCKDCSLWKDGWF